MASDFKVFWSSRAKVIGYMVFEEPVKILDDARIANCEIGAYTVINRRAEVALAKVGRYTSIGPNVVIGAGDHPTDRLTTSPVTYGPQFDFFINGAVDLEPFDGNKHVQIGHDVWIGANAVITTGVTVGNGAIIGAGAVVTKDVEPFTVVGGVPARPIRDLLDPEMKELVSELQWWRYDLLQWRQNGSLPRMARLTTDFLSAARTAIEAGRAPFISSRRCVADFRSQTPIMKRVPDDFSIDQPL